MGHSETGPGGYAELGVSASDLSGPFTTKSGDSSYLILHREDRVVSAVIIPHDDPNRAIQWERLLHSAQKTIHLPEFPKDAASMRHHGLSVSLYSWNDEGGWEDVRWKEFKAKSPVSQVLSDRCSGRIILIAKDLETASLLEF